MKHCGEADSDGLSSHQVRIRLLFCLNAQEILRCRFRNCTVFEILPSAWRRRKSNLVMLQGRYFLILSVTGTEWRNRLPSPLYHLLSSRQSSPSDPRSADFPFNLAAVLSSGVERWKRVEQVHISIWQK